MFRRGVPNNGGNKKMVSISVGRKLKTIRYRQHTGNQWHKEVGMI